jgi:hypothetical protein
MKYFRLLALVGVLAVLPLSVTPAHAQVSVGIGFGPGYYGAPPVCQWGYYDYAPYACAPYGFYGPNWFSSGIFIGAGPWFHPYGGFYGRPYGYGRAFYNRGVFVGRGYGHPFVARGRVGGFHGPVGRGFNGGAFHGNGGFHGNSGSFHGNGGFHGNAGGFHGGGGGGFHGGGGHGGRR